MTSESEICLHELFEFQADRSGGAVAIECGHRRITYAELDRRANQLARWLRRLGAGAGQYVAIYLGRSELPIIAILACHKSGAAYVPVDPVYPGARIRHIAEELEVSLCLTESALSTRAETFFTGSRRVVLDAEWPRIATMPDSRVGREESGITSRDPAYVIYTSGTTGRPKGVTAEHRQVARFVTAFNEVCATGAGDRVYQGFSLSFDGSVEEIWMALSNGSALVVPARDAPRFGDELGQYLTELGITYFSTVPTLMSTVTSGVASLRTLVLSGEVCRPELVARLARPGLRILNAYGPTEATVNTTVAECVPGRPVTIGRPLRGYGIHIVDEDLRPVPHGAKGELLISGETLARGYFKQPELTSERFLTAAVLDGAGSTRCYRTGDLVHWNPMGELEFSGRIDGQVKVRGYRVELAEVESVLLEHPRIRSAVVTLAERDGLQDLAAYVVVAPRSVAPNRNEILSLLESRVPAYMIPGYLDVVVGLPRTASGKIDRKRLPPPVSALVRTSASPRPPENYLERVIAGAWTEILGVPALSAEADFFLDLGGHSLLAARMVTLLRERTGRPVAVRDAYRFPTVRTLAAHLETISANTGTRPADPARREADAISSRATFESTPKWQRVTTWTMQTLSLYLIAAVVAVPLAVLFRLGLGWVEGTLSTSVLLGAIVLLSLITWPLLLTFSVVAKWILIGRYKPGDHRLWSWYYWRWWLANRIGALSGVTVLSGTPLLPVYYRLMGARVGPRCTIDTVHCSTWDLVSIGADTSIGASTQILGYRVENGMLRLGRVDIGSGCFIGIHSALGLDVTMGDNARLDDQSLLPDRDAIPPGAGRRGSPAHQAEVRLPRGIASPARSRRALFALLHLVAAIALPIVAVLVPALSFLALAWFFFRSGGLVVGVVATLAWVPVNVVLYCLYLAGWKRLLLSRIEPGIYPVLSLVYLRKWLSDGLMSLTRAALLPVYTTLYLPPLLRLMGARIGPRAEISTVWSFAPELVDVGAESFFADGAIIGGRRCHRGLCEIAVNRVGRRSFVGNGAVLPVGHSLGDRCLLGVQSVVSQDDRCLPDGTEWLGSPPFALTHRLKVGDFDTTVTFEPTRGLYWRRGVIDGLRVLIPPYLLLIATALFGVSLFLVNRGPGLGAMLAAAPITGFLSALWAALMVVVVKWAVMGTYRPEIKPLWSKYVWLNEMVNGIYESVMAPVLSSLLGTPFAAPLLRLMGCRIGRHTYLATTLFSEFDLVEIGDHVALNHGVVVQNHLFEDRVFKSSKVKIADEASVGNMSVILYDSEMERGAVVGPLSLLMKGETLRQGTRWEGIPTAVTQRHGARG